MSSLFEKVRYKIIQVVICKELFQECFEQKCKWYLKLIHLHQKQIQKAK